ncbi:MAG: hypothetical protein EXS05_02855 [Planctomycetaceae bacterium]|nr:hypothetical protein [Planctomycetaceae bacterium]
MKKLSRLTLLVTLYSTWACVLGAGFYGVGSLFDCVALAAQAPTDADEPNRPRSATGEIKRAREKLLKYASIQAEIVETVTIGDRSYKAEGRYLQTGLQPPDDWRMRLELTLKVGDSTGTLLEVCDGDVLWTSTLINTGRKSGLAEQNVSRRNVTQILNAARKLSKSTESDLIANMGLGGLPGLLASIERDMKFTSVKEETLRDRPMLVIQGTWSDKFLEQIKNPQQQKAASPLLLPFFPESVRIYIDRETGFPHRIVYRKSIPGRDVQRDMLILDYLEVAINQPIDGSEFAYEPPSGVQAEDITNLFLDQLAPRETPGQGRGGTDR